MTWQTRPSMVWYFHIYESLVIFCPLILCSNITRFLDIISPYQQKFFFQLFAFVILFDQIWIRMFWQYLLANSSVNFKHQFEVISPSTLSCAWYLILDQYLMSFMSCLLFLLLLPYYFWCLRFQTSVICLLPPLST